MGVLVYTVKTGHATSVGRGTHLKVCRKLNFCYTSFTDMVALEMTSRLTEQLTHSNVLCSSISVNLISGLRYIQLKPDTLHLLDAEHILRDTVTLKTSKHPLQA